MLGLLLIPVVVYACIKIDLWSRERARQAQIDRLSTGGVSSDE
ncbi:hypothetical protein [Salinadaptatus halalkaliphilus]|nr:hypothetical protein [Salinadaptatus halalkaliphilus]